MITPQPTMLPLLLLLRLSRAAAAPQQWYVSPLGRDGWSGSLPEPNAAGT